MKLLLTHPQTALPLPPPKFVPPEDINELNVVFPNILKNIMWFTSKFNRNDFVIVYDFDFDTFGFISILSLLSGTPEVKF